MFKNKSAKDSTFNNLEQKKIASSKDSGKSKDQPVDLPSVNPISSYQIKMREDTIPVIVVNGVYFPTQKLRFKINDPNLNFRKSRLFGTLIIF